MRIPGTQLRTPVTITPAGASTGDGVVPGTPKTVKGSVKYRKTIVDDTTGQTLILWTTAQIRPRVLVGTPPRSPAPGDTMTVGGQTRKIASVQPVTGPGSQVSYLELTAGDG
jgi:hypothetical protein